MTVRWLTARILEGPGIAHGFFQRMGGVSQGIYESLNCGLGSRDDADAVRENRRRVAAALGPGVKLVTQSQIHSAIVHPVALPDADPAAVRQGDGMVSATPGVALGILTADCAPVLLADAQARVIGAAHAGWKGALGTEQGGVLENTIAAMEELGANRTRIRAAIGPAITQDNYEVGWEFRDRFLERGLRYRRFFVPSGREGHYRFDLKGYGAHRLEVAGIADVEILPACTYPPQNGFFSFRRATHAAEPDYGRQISAIALIP
jgi:YfiH family protein